MSLPQFGALKNLPLHQASADGNAGRVVSCLERGAKIGARTETGATALHLAVQAGHLAIVNILLAHGADVNARDHQGQAPLHLAASAGQAGIVANLLMHANIDPHIRDVSGRVPLHFSAAQGDTDVANILFGKGTDCGAVDHLGRTPLHDAVAHNHLAMTEFLIRRCANIETGDNFHRTPLILATMQGFTELVMLLLAHGANVNASDHFGRTALHEAAQRNHIPIASALLQQGASVTAADQLGRTASFVAAAQNNPEMVAFLKKISTTPPAQADVADSDDATCDGVKQELTRLSTRALHQARMFEEMLAAFPDQIYLFDQRGRFTYANPSAARVLGIPQANFIGKQWHDLPLPAECAGPLMQQCMHVFSSGNAVTGEISLPTAEGIRQYEYILNALHSADGAIVTVVCTARDITVRKLAEDAIRKANETLELRVNERTAELRTANARLQEELQRRTQIESELRASEERFRLLSAAAFEGILISEAGNIRDANQQFAHLLGYSVADLLGKSLFDYIAPEDRALVMRHVAGGYDQPYSCRALRQDGTTMVIEVHGKTMPNVDRHVRVTAVREKRD